MEMEAESLNDAERESRLQQEIAELNSRRQPSAENLRRYESLEENRRTTARELKSLHEEVVGLKRGGFVFDCRTTLIAPEAKFQLYQPSSPNGMINVISNSSMGLEPTPISPRDGPRNPSFVLERRLIPRSATAAAPLVRVARERSG
jgi:hypothetical protein